MKIHLVLNAEIAKNTAKICTDKFSDVMKKFSNIYLDDSTSIALPDELTDVFPGNVTHGKKKQ